MSTPDEILSYWFGGGPPENLDAVLEMIRRLGPGLDDEIRERYGELVERARRGELDSWAETPRGLLALVLVLDQFPRHIYRGTGRQYDSDTKALGLALRALDAGWHEDMHPAERSFLSMPLVHSEDVEIQRRSVELADWNAERAPEWLDWVNEIGPSQSRKYLDVIERFGRFPHRNELLGRESTPEELEFLETWAERQPPDALRERGLV